MGNGTAPAVPLRSRFIVLVLYSLLVSPVVLFPLRLPLSRPCRPQPQLVSSTLGIPAFLTLSFSASCMPLLCPHTLLRVRIRRSIVHSAVILLKGAALSPDTRAVDVTALLHASVPRALSRNSLATLAHVLSPLRFSSVIWGSFPAPSLPVVNKTHMNSSVFCFTNSSSPSLPTFSRKVSGTLWKPGSVVHYVAPLTACAATSRRRPSIASSTSPSSCIQGIAFTRVFAVPSIPTSQRSFLRSTSAHLAMCVSPLLAELGACPHPPSYRAPTSAFELRQRLTSSLSTSSASPPMRPATRTSSGTTCSLKPNSTSAPSSPPTRPHFTLSSPS